MTTTLVLGPVRSGKSRYAQSLMAAYNDVTYIATGPEADPADAEWAERVRQHQTQRPESWQTLVTLELTRSLIRARTPVLVDCVSNWVSGIVGEAGLWKDPQGAREHVENELESLVVAWRHLPFDLVAVSNEVGWGVVPPTLAGRHFRDLVGIVNTRLSGVSDQVRLVAGGRVLNLDEAPLIPAPSQ